MLPVMLMAIECDDDREFMTELYSKYRRLMLSEARKVLGNDGAIQDVVQDSLVRLVDKLSLLQSLDDAKRVCYLITTVRNQARNYVRKNSASPALSLDDEGAGLANQLSDGTDVEREIIRREQLKRLSQIWPKLDETNRALLEKKYLLRQSDEEIAEYVGIKPSSVRMMLTRARRSALELLTK